MTSWRDYLTTGLGAVVMFVLCYLFVVLATLALGE